MSPNPPEFDAALPDDAAELELWKQLIFDPNMGPHDDRARPHLPQLPPETYTYLVQALLSLQSSAHPHTHSPIAPPYHHPWPRSAAPATPSSYPTTPPIPLLPYLVPQSTSSSQLAPSPAASSATASTLQDPDGTEEDKRRRNTAASARFRVKKKLKTLNLERTVADLTGRTEELEREANDLRRENTWLKEIVLLKSKHLATLTLGSQAPAPGHPNDGDEREDCTEAGPEPESAGGKGKDREE